MVFGKDAEDPEEAGPYENEEDNDEEQDLPCFGVRAGPQVLPVAAVGGGEPVVLNDDDDKEPLFIYC